MIKVGDRVAPIFDMGAVGIVVELKQSPVKTWMMGGAMSQEFRAVIKLDDPRDRLVEYRCSELMRID
jgi:hypothetical protein